MQSPSPRRFERASRFWLAALQNLNLGVEIEFDDVVGGDLQNESATRGGGRSGRFGVDPKDESRRDSGDHFSHGSSRTWSLCDSMFEARGSGPA